MRKLVAVVLGALLFVSGCGNGAQEAQPTPTLAPTVSFEAVPEPPAQAAVEPSAHLLGFIVPDGQDEMLTTAKHGFLRTAENLGYPAKLYTGVASSYAQLVEEAIADACSALLVWPEGANYKAAMEQARQAGITVVAPYYEVESGAADANVYVDWKDSYGEIARLLCEGIREKQYTYGKVVVLGGEESQLAADLIAAIQAGYPQYAPQQLTLASGTNIESITAYVRDTPELLGVIALDGSAALWSQAKKAVEEELKPTPSPSSAATGTPSPTPTSAFNPTKRDVSIIALDYTRQNVSLVRGNSISGLIARPYFDAVAQSTMLLDRLLRGQNVPLEVTLNAPLIRAGGLEKYDSIVNEAAAWFELPALDG